MSFLTSFGKGIPDLRINCAGGRLTVEVAYAWYYLRKQFVTDVNEEGVLHIADLEKVLSSESFFPIQDIENSFLLNSLATDKAG